MHFSSVLGLFTSECECLFDAAYSGVVRLNHRETGTCLEWIPDILHLLCCYIVFVRWQYIVSCVTSLPLTTSLRWSQRDNIVFIRSTVLSQTIFRLLTCRLFIFRYSSFYEWVIESFIKQINYTNSNDSLHLPTTTVWLLFSPNDARLHISTAISSSPIKGDLYLNDL